MIRTASILLAGGKSQRMGEDKAHLRLGDQSFAALVAQTLRATTGYVVVVRAPGQVLPSDLHADLILDDRTRGEGPLVALTHGLHALEGRAEIAFAASVDAPYLKPDLVRGILATLTADPERDLAVPRTKDRTHPLCAAYRVSLVASADELIESGRRRLHDLLEVQNTLYLTEDTLRPWDDTLASLININTPDQLRDAREPRP